MRVPESTLTDHEPLNERASGNIYMSYLVKGSAVTYESISVSSYAFDSGTRVCARALHEKIIN